MVTYRRLVDSLGLVFGTPKLNAVLLAISHEINLRRDGGYRASLTYQREGLHCVFDWQNPEWILNSIILFAEGVDGFRQFPDLIEGVISLPAIRLQVREALGNPSLLGGGAQKTTTADYHWDRYDRDNYSIRFDFHSEHGGIRAATLMTPETVREFDIAKKQGIQKTQA